MSDKLFKDNILRNLEKLDEISKVNIQKKYTDIKKMPINKIILFLIFLLSILKDDALLVAIYYLLKKLKNRKKLSKNNWDKLQELLDLYNDIEKEYTGSKNPDEIYSEKREKIFKK